jgi:hypothetical protein
VAFDACKGPLRHAWYEVDSDWAAPFGGTPFTLRCDRCGTERRDSFDLHGELMTRRYVYPEGYRLAEGETKATMQDLRLRILAVSKYGQKESRLRL